VTSAVEPNHTTATTTGIIAAAVATRAQVTDGLAKMGKFEGEKSSFGKSQ
jgi:hypothetical protein